MVDVTHHPSVTNLCKWWICPLILSIDWYKHWYIHWLSGDLWLDWLRLDGLLRSLCRFVGRRWHDRHDHFYVREVMIVMTMLQESWSCYRNHDNVRGEMTMLQATWLTATTAGVGWSVGHSSTTARTPRTSPRRGSPWTWTVRRRTSTLWPPRRRWASGFLVSGDTVISRTAPTATLTPTSRGASARASSTSASTMTSALGSLL